MQYLIMFPQSDKYFSEFWHYSIATMVKSYCCHGNELFISTYFIVLKILGERELQ